MPDDLRSILLDGIADLKEKLDDLQTKLFEADAADVERCRASLALFTGVLKNLRKQADKAEAVLRESGVA